jgi:plastocyanin
VNKKLSALSISLTLSALAFGACAEDSQQAAPTGATAATSTPAIPNEAAVQVAQFKFAPAQLEIPAGTTVRWDNSDEILHTATSGAPDAATGDFDGQMSGAGTSFSFTFETPGTYVYFCSRHVFMAGEVVVT